MGELGQSDLPPEGSRRHKCRKGFGMIDAVLLYGMIYPAAGVALLSIIWLVVRGRVPDRVLWIVTGGGVFASVIRLVYLYRSGVLGVDYRIFYEAGRDVLAGVSPYSPSRFASHPFLNPPSTFPFFALIAMPPYPTSLAVWTLVNSVMAFGLVWQARRTLFVQDGGTPSSLSHAELGALAAAFGLSDACMATIQLGQLSLLVTVLILLALEFQGRQMPARAGAALGVATMKVGTMVPFLLLFCRKQDRKSWIVLVATTAALILLGGQAPRIFEDLRSMLHYVGEFSKPGQINDISYQGPYNEWILGFDHLAYRLGMRERTMLAVVQFIALGLIGGWLAWEVIAEQGLSGTGGRTRVALLGHFPLSPRLRRSHDRARPGIRRRPGEEPARPVPPSLHRRLVVDACSALYEAENTRNAHRLGHGPPWRGRVADRNADSSPGSLANPAVDSVDEGSNGRRQKSRLVGLHNIT